MIFIITILLKKTIHVWYFFTSLACAYGLKCWHCIADDCDEDLGGNYKASKKTCYPGQICQVRYRQVIFLSGSFCTLHVNMF